MHRTLALAAALATLPAGARADTRMPADVRGVDLVRIIAPAEGFVDDPLGFDDGGGRLAYVVADAAERARLIVEEVADGRAVLSADLSRFTTAPSGVRFAAGGERLLVTARAGDRQAQAAALIDPSGKVLRRFGPADAIGYGSYGGRESVATYRAERLEERRGPGRIRHTVEVFDLARGRRVGRRTTIETDLQNYSKKLGFTIRTWADGYATAIGIREGRWNRKEDQRSPDHEAWYDLPAQRFRHEASIKDVIGHARLMQILARHPNQPSFVRVADDRSGIERIEGGAISRVTVAEEFIRYEPKSLRSQRHPDGTIFFTLQIDPVNPVTLQRRKAEPTWIDLYELGPGAAAAVRRARLLPPEGRELRWAATREHLAVLVAHAGFSRGGERLIVYRLKERRRR